MKRSAVVWTNSICACSEPMLLTPWTAVRRGRFAGKPFLGMRPKLASMASPLIDGGKGQRDGERGPSGGQTSGSAAARTLRAGDNRRAGRIHSPDPCRRPDRAGRREISPARLRAQGGGGQGQNIAWP